MTAVERAAAARAAVAPVVTAAGRRGIGVGELTLSGGFWGTRQQVNGDATLEHCLSWMERLGWLANFDRVASGTTDASRPGWQFSDSEVYKLMEAMVWEEVRTGDPWVSSRLAALTARIGAAQDEDGYLNTAYGHAGQAPRYSDMSSGHELYCTGFLLQAAVARYRAVGPDPLVEIARRAADHVCREFGPDGTVAICGHPEIELGLVELGRALDEPRYVEQARLFLERRGRGLLEPVPLLGPAYFQDDQPVRDAEVWRGHAVRALYLAAAAVDVAVDTGDAQLVDAVERQWSRTVERRTYLTGGMGSRHQDEGFGEDWELPADRAYCETCAGIASVMVSWRLYLATGDVRYPDLIERTLFNVVATSPRADGRAFFYANPLQQRTAGAEADAEQVNPRAEGGLRAPWFEVSCCPTNVARTLAAWQAYAASVEGDMLTLMQYATGELRVELDSGVLVLQVRTEYPTAGLVELEVVETPGPRASLRLRVPDWALGATLTRASTPGRPADPGRAVDPGWAVLDDLRAGDTWRLGLPTAPRLTWPDARIDGLRGTVAVERGPLVLCLQSRDLPGASDLSDLYLDVDAPIADTGEGAMVALVSAAARPARPGRPPYGPAGPSDSGHGSQPARLVPYHSWAQDGPTAMRVFLPVGPDSGPRRRGGSAGP